jgi:hypothetical protein
LFVIIKLEFPSNFPQNIAPSISRNDVVQAKEHHHDQANEDLMEEDDGTNQVNDPMEEYDGKNQMIQKKIRNWMRMGKMYVFMMNLY